VFGYVNRFEREATTRGGVPTLAPAPAPVPAAAPVSAAPVSRASAGGGGPKKKDTHVFLDAFENEEKQRQQLSCELFKVQRGYYE